MTTQPIGTTRTDRDAADTHTRKTDVSPRAITAEGAFVVERFREDERIHVTSLEQHLPRPLRQRGTVTIHDPEDFAQYVNRLCDHYSTVLYANVATGTVTVVFDDHSPEGIAGWREHRAELALKADPDWTRWTEADSKLMSQEGFATFLEEVAHTIVRPDAATLLEVATTFRATRKADFSGGVRLQSGDVEFRYKEETDAKAGKSGKLEIPETFTVWAAPWRGVDAVELTARLRYRLDDGALRIGYALLRPDRARDDAFALILARLREAVDEAVLQIQGVAPQPVRLP
jgi:uncharacterized protein YfdQ (DUF2303 family)